MKRQLLAGLVFSGLLLVTGCNCCKSCNGGLFAWKKGCNTCPPPCAPPCCPPSAVPAVPATSGFAPATDVAPPAAAPVFRP